jgi:hypothetical protein
MEKKVSINRTLLSMAQMSIVMVLLCGCGTAVKINPKGCISGARWQTHNREILDYESQYRPFAAKDIYAQYPFVLKKRINSPLGLFSTHEVFLKTILEREGIGCEDIKNINITSTNEWWDVVSSFIPFLATKTFYLYGEMWSDSKRFQTGREDLKEEELDELEEIPGL